MNYDVELYHSADVHHELDMFSKYIHADTSVSGNQFPKRKVALRNSKP